MSKINPNSNFTHFKPKFHKIQLQPPIFVTQKHRQLVSKKKKKRQTGLEEQKKMRKKRKLHRK
jgi:hypothetical protein